VTKDQLLIMIEDSDYIQYKVLEILAAKINYGGRVTDDKDERFIQTFVRKFLNPEMLTGK
jgi:dynein heavy chain